MSIIEAVRAQRLKQLVRSNAHGEQYAEGVHRKAEFVQAMLKGTATDVDEHNLQHLYYQHVTAYTGNKYANPTIRTKRQLAYWRSVGKAVKTSGVAPSKYMAAQFNYFDKVFGTYPKVQQLHTEAAITRALEFTGNTKTLVKRYKSTNTTADVMRQADKQVRQMCKAQKLTREQFYKKLVLTGIVSLPKVFLEADPAYRKAKEST